MIQINNTPPLELEVEGVFVEEEEVEEEEVHSVETRLTRGMESMMIIIRRNLLNS